MQNIPTNILVQKNHLFALSGVPAPLPEHIITPFSYFVDNKKFYHCNSITNDVVNRMKKCDTLSVFFFSPSQAIKNTYPKTVNDIENYFTVYASLVKKIHKIEEDIKDTLFTYANANKAFCPFCQSIHTLDQLDTTSLNIKLNNCLETKIKAYESNTCPYCPSVVITPEEKHLHILTTSHYNNFYQGFIFDSKNNMNNVNILSTTNFVMTNLMFCYDYFYYQKFLNSIDLLQSVKDLIFKQKNHYLRDTFNIRTWLTVIMDYLNDTNQKKIACEECLKDLNTASPISIQTLMHLNNKKQPIMCECGKELAFVYDTEAYLFLKTILDYVPEQKNVLMSTSVINEQANDRTTKKQTSLSKDIREKVSFNAINNSNKDTKYQSLILRFKDKLLTTASQFFENDDMALYLFIEEYYLSGKMQDHDKTITNAKVTERLFKIYYYVLVHNHAITINVQHLTAKEYDAFNKYTKTVDNVFVILGQNISKHEKFDQNFNVDTNANPHNLYEAFYSLINPDMDTDADFHDAIADDNINDNASNHTTQNAHRKPPDDMRVWIMEIKNELRLESKDTRAQKNGRYRRFCLKHHPDKAMRLITFDFNTNPTEYENQKKKLTEEMEMRFRYISGIYEEWEKNNPE